MERDRGQTATFTQKGGGSRQAAVQLGQLLVDVDPERLKRARGRINAIFGSPDHTAHNFAKLAGAGDRRYVR